MSETSTIRVSRETRDLLAEQARERGISVAALVSEIAQERRRAAIFHAERAATRTDAQNRAVDEELRDWDEVLADGLD